MTTTPSPAPGATAPRPTPTLDRMFDALRRSPVRRSQQRVVAGVCAGIAERLGVSVAIVRVVAVIAAVLGPAVVLYLAAWLLLPHVDGSIRLEKAVRGGDAASIVLLVLTVLAVLPDAGAHAHLGWVVPVLVVAAVGAFLWSRSTGRSVSSLWSSSGRATTTGAPTAGPTAGPTQAPPTTPGPQDTPHV